MDRRTFMAASAAALTAAPALARAAPLDLESAAAEAWIYCVMPIENAGARANALRLAAPNTLRHAYELTTPATQSVTSPNNDTLYSRAWIDLRAGPAVLDMPRSGERYISYHFMDMYGNSFAVLGSRTTGGEAHRVRLVGPADATDDPMALRAPTPWVWLLIRTLIDGEADRPAANALQNAIRLTAPPAPVPPAEAPRNAPWDRFFASAQALLRENPPPVTDLAFFERVSALGLGPTGGFDPARFSSAEAARIEAGIARARQQVNGRRAGQVRNGWVYPKANLGDFGQDYLYRAQVAIGGLAALTVQEAMYMRPVGPDGGLNLDSSRAYLLRFEPGQLPPVDGFWSLTAYARTPDGQQFFFDNPIGRYAIGDRTPGLVRGADGSLEIHIQRADPGGARRANWLPSPPDAPLGLSFRTYLPRAELMDGAYSLPALRAV